MLPTLGDYCAKFSSCPQAILIIFMQFQLILGEYFLVNLEAAETAEQATNLIGWILNHGQVGQYIMSRKQNTRFLLGRFLLSSWQT